MHQPLTPPSTNNNRSTPAQFKSKLGTYLTGVVIGFLLLGSIYYQKHLATQRIEANAQADTDAQAQPASTGTEVQP